MYGYGVYAPGTNRAMRGSVQGQVPGISVGVPKPGMEMFDEAARKMAEDWAAARIFDVASAT